MTWLARDNVPSDPRRRLYRSKKPACSALRQDFRSTPNSSTHSRLQARTPTQGWTRPSPTPFAGGSGNWLAIHLRRKRAQHHTATCLTVSSPNRSRLHQPPQAGRVSSVCWLPSLLEDKQL